jgi:hypothetical protein
MKPEALSLARYTRPNLPLPRGRPISNMPRWSCLGMEACSGREASESRSSSASSDVRDEEGRAFRGGDEGALAFRWAAWEGSTTAALALPL